MVCAAATERNIVERANPIRAAWRTITCASMAANGRRPRSDCSSASDPGGFRLSERNRCSRHQAVKDIRAEVDIVGPLDSSKFAVDTRLTKEAGILQWLENPTLPYDPTLKIHGAAYSVRESQFQSIVPNGSNMRDSMAHGATSTADCNT